MICYYYYNTGFIQYSANGLESPVLQNKAQTVQEDPICESFQSKGREEGRGKKWQKH